MAKKAFLITESLIIFEKMTYNWMASLCLIFSQSVSFSLGDILQSLPFAALVILTVEFSNIAPEKLLFPSVTSLWSFTELNTSSTDLLFFFVDNCKLCTFFHTTMTISQLKFKCVSFNNTFKRTSLYEANSITQHPGFVFIPSSLSNIIFITDRFSAMLRIWYDCWYFDTAIIFAHWPIILRNPSAEHFHAVKILNTEDDARHWYMVVRGGLNCTDFSSFVSTCA